MNHFKLLNLNSTTKDARWIVAPVVVGSIPITHPKLSNRFQDATHSSFTQGGPTCPVKVSN
jgi:hypothetical protein